MNYKGKITQATQGRFARVLLYKKILASWHTSYAAVCLFLLVFLFISSPSVLVSADEFGPGSQVGIPARTCSTPGGWDNSTEATGKPSLKDDAAAADFSVSKAALLQKGKGELRCDGFKLPEQRRQHVRLGLSLAAKSSQSIIENITNSNKHDADSAPFLLDKEPVGAQQTTLGAPSLDAVLRVSVSGDEGKSWTPIYTLDTMDTANATIGGYLAISLPSDILNNLADMSVRLEGLREGDMSTHVYVDSVFLTYQVAPGQKMDIHPVGQPEDSATFGIGQPPAFVLELDRQGEGVMQGLAARLGGGDTSDKPTGALSVTVKDAEGHETADIGARTAWKGKALNGNDTWAVSFTQPTHITAGKNTLVITQRDAAGNSQSTEQDFLWGVLAINTHKSIYQDGDTVHFDMAVLDEKGEMVCDAGLLLRIDGPVDAELSTDEGTIKVNQDECRSKSILAKPDYAGQWKIPKLPVGNIDGTYTLTLTSKTKNGEYTVTDSFRVGAKEAATVTRTAATRIMPANRYTVELKVATEAANFAGDIVEVVPDSFTITDTEKMYTLANGDEMHEPTIIETSIQPGKKPGTKEIIWKNVQLEKGRDYKLLYTYKAPNTSPEFYLTGPLSMQSGDTTVFSEQRQWQIAGDAPWLVGWTFRKALTIDQTLVDANLTDLPVLVKLTSSNFNFDNSYQPGGVDIRFTSSDMVTPLEYDRERFDYSASAAEFWVKVPAVSGTVDTVIYMYYGNYIDPSDGENAAATWNSAYVGVYHMNDDPARVCTTPVQSTYNECDSTTNARHGTGQGSMFTSDVVAGKTAYGIDFDGTDDAFTFGDVNALDGVNRMTLSGWVKINTLKDYGILWAKWVNSTTKWMIQSAGSTDGTNNDVLVSVSNAAAGNCWTTTNIVAAGVWNHWVFVYDGTLTGNTNRAKIFFNGTQRALTCTGTIGATTPATAASLQMGGYATGPYMIGVIDEARISNDAKAAAWVKATYNAENNTLLKAFGTEEQGNLPAEAPDTTWWPTFDNARVNTTTPVIGGFASYDYEGDLLTYELQIDDNASFSSPTTHSSANHASNGFSQASFNGYSEPAMYQTDGSDGFSNGGTYWWRARAMDAAGTATWSAYSKAFSFTTDTTTGPVNQWFQTSDAQFDSNQTFAAKSNGTGAATLAGAKYRYLRWTINQRRGPTANSVQVAEFALRYNGADVAWPVGTTATNPGGSNPANQGASSAIDLTFGPANKWLDLNFNLGNDSVLTGSSVLQIDVGAGNTVNFNGYRWQTAEDANARDPTGWVLAGSNDGTNWSTLDSRTGQTISTTRSVWTSEYVIQTKHEYRYVRWEVNQWRAVETGLQFAEFQLMDGSTAVAWPSGTTATTPGGSFYPTQGPTQAIDGNTATKFLDFNFGSNGKTTLQIDAGANKTMRFTGYRYTTADDFANRDPIGWKVYASNDGTTWQLLDTKASQTVTTSRLTNTSTYTPDRRPGTIFSKVAYYPSVDEAETWALSYIGSSEPNASNILLRFYFASSTVCDTIISDASLPGNSAGFDASSLGSIDLSGLNTTSIDVLCVEAEFVQGATTSLPQLFGWYITWGKNLAPVAPLNADQRVSNDSASIPVGVWYNQSNVLFKASNITDPNATDTLIFCVEVKVINVAFEGLPTQCTNDTAYTGTPLTMSVSISLANNTMYHWQAWVLDNGHTYNRSSADVSFGLNSENDPDISIDTTAPTGGTVYDGTSTGVDATYSDTSLTQLSANWSGVSSTPSGLSKYEYSIGTTPGGTTIKGWTDNGTATAVTATGLTLQTSVPYYVNVRATDNATNVQSPVLSSNGQIVAPSLGFAVSPASMAFDNLNATNNYISTKTTTVTTTTNAYAGYVVRLAANTNLAAGSYSLAMFDGGTYALPDSWQAADRGIGYTSNDTTIQGSNKFQAATCPGGSSLIAPGCYAPYSLTKPGDIIADNTTSVPSGQPFTITHRVNASATQQASTYSTVLIYAATALY